MQFISSTQVVGQVCAWAWMAFLAKTSSLPASLVKIQTVIAEDAGLDTR